MTFQTAQAAIYDAFLAGFSTLNANTQVVFGPEPFDPPSETTWARLEVYAPESALNAMGPVGARDWRRDGVAMATFYLVAPAADSAMNTLTQLYTNTFEGADVGDVLFGSGGVKVSPTGQDGRWQTKTCRAPFHFLETR